MKHVFLLFILIGFTACGFSPVYNDATPGGDVHAQLSSIDIATIPDREGQYVRNALIDRINNGGYTSTPSYKLSVSPIKENSVDIGIDTDDEASRAQLRESATIHLIDIETNNVVLKRTVRSVTSYNILAGQFTTYVNEQSTRDQALQALADEIVTELELYFGANPS